jgi:hypothetical protein
MNAIIPHCTRKKYVSCSLMIVLIAAVVLSGCTSNQPPSTKPDKTLLTVRVGAQSFNYTLKNLTSLDNVTGPGASISRSGNITGPNNYTGVTISVLLRSIPSLPTNFTVRAIASDGYAVNYTMNETNGHPFIFNESGAGIGNGNLTLIIAYKENGVFLNKTTRGPLLTAFIGNATSLTASGRWVSSVTTIEIV